MKSILLIGLMAASANCLAASLPFYDSLDRMKAVVGSSSPPVARKADLHREINRQP